MRISAVIKKEFRQIRRDHRSLFLILAVPALLVLLFGYALSFDVKHIRTGFLDFDQSSESRRLARALLSSEYFDLTRWCHNRAEIGQGLDSGAMSVAVVIPAGFERDLRRGAVPAIQAIIDGSNAQMATIIQGYVNAFAQTYVVRLVANQLLQVSGQTMAMPVGLEPRIWYNPELKSSMFLIPGLIVYILILVATISTAISVVRERERGTIEQLLVSPLTPAELIIGKTIPYIFLGLLDAGIVLWVSYIFFGLTIKGSALLLFLSMILFILAGLAQGILISAATSSQQVAFQLASLLTMLPTLLLSGFIYPIRNMILPLRIISHLVPARYFINVIRGILLKGVDAHVIWQDLLWLGLFTLVMLLLAIRKLGKTRLL